MYLQTHRRGRIRARISHWDAGQSPVLHGPRRRYLLTHLEAHHYEIVDNAISVEDLEIYVGLNI